MGYGQVAGPDPSLLTQPSRATNQALAKAGLTVGDVDLFEINEAFAAVGLTSTDDLGIPEEEPAAAPVDPVPGAAVEAPPA